MPERLYLDNAATSFPKPATVALAMSRFVTECGASAGRGAYREAIEAGEMMVRCRDLVARLIGAPDDGDRWRRVAFTLNCTDALNLAIRGVVFGARERKGPMSRAPHVVTTWMDHNSILRPLAELERRAECAVTRVRADGATGRVDPEEIRRAIRAAGGAALVATQHASNVCGVVQDIAAVGRVCREEGALLMVDAAQTIGRAPIDVDAMGIDLLAFPGHKGLMGPLGTGGLYVARGVEDRLATVREGGTGTRSEEDSQPREMPALLEAGSANGAGVAGLLAGIEWVMERGVEEIAGREREVGDVFLRTLQGAARVPGPDGMRDRVPVFGVVIDGLAAHEVAAALESHFGLLTRAGLHCAPLAHKNLGTFPDGATRVSFGALSTTQDAPRPARALREVAAEVGAGR